MLIQDRYSIGWGNLLKPPPISTNVVFKNGELASSLVYIGIEIEAENYRGFDCSGETVLNIMEFWSHKPEPSLRHHGIEFVSPPIKGQHINYALSLLHTMNTVGCLTYGDLAGLHIHLNVRNFSTDQFANLAMLNVVFEDTLYRISGNRNKNIYCCPSRTSKSGLPNIVATKDLDVCMARANKYLGFNYLTIKKFGTVEYRHSQGSSDIDYIRNWINVLLCLHIMAIISDNSLLKEELFALNTTSQYQKFVNKVFNRFAHLVNHPLLSSEMCEGILILKEWCIEPMDHIYSNKILDRPARQNQLEKKS